MRPLPAHIRRARERGVCPWCGYSTEGLESTLCPECGNNLTAPQGPPDPGTPSRARWALFFAFALIIAVALMQQLGTSALQPPKTPGEIERPSVQFEFTAKIFAKVEAALPDPNLRRSAVKALDDQSHSDADTLRAAMLAGELLGADQARTRLDRLEPSLSGESPLLEDIRALRAIYDGQRPDAATAQRLKKDHGWLGELAAAHGLPGTDPARARLLGGGWMILLLTCVVGFVVFGATIAGVVLLILALVQGAGKRLKSEFTPPSPGGSLAIEMVALFVLGFLLLQAASSAAELWLSARQALWFTLVAQWMLLAVCLWPRFRNVRAGMTLMGWHRGAGVWREIGAGFIGYLACIPIMFVGVIISLTLVFIYTALRHAVTGQAPAAAPENPVLEIASGRSGVLVTVMIFVLASLWAPIVEETIFRGCFYRHLRSHWHWLPAGLLTALCFGLMHGYPVLMLGPVIALGFGFSLLREWRGSLIAPMTAHFIHNTFVLGMLLVAMRLIGA